MQENYRAAVYALVRLIPAGTVLSYGDIAEILSEWPQLRGGPRQVAKIMSTSDGQLPWWRVVRSNGTLPADLAALAHPSWISEQTPVRETGDGEAAVRIAAARWQPSDEDFDAIEQAVTF